jgi:DNA-binding transcriptional ArsR family regulator
MFQITDKTTQFYDIRSLEFFWLTVKTGRVTYAANCLNVSQPAVSNAIAKIEKNLGVTLLIRGGQRQISLTDEGRRLYLYAETIFSTQRQQIIFPSFLLETEVFTHQIVAVNTLPGEIFTTLHMNCREYSKANVVSISLKSLDLYKAVQGYNKNEFSVAIVPNTGVGTSLAISGALVNTDIKETCGIYGATNHLEYLKENESILVMLRCNFYLLGVDVSYVSSPILVDTYEELVGYILQPGYYVMLTSHQLKVVSVYSVSISQVVRKHVDPKKYRIYTAKEKDLTTYSYGIASKESSTCLVKMILQGVDFP